MSRLKRIPAGPIDLLAQLDSVEGLESSDFGFVRSSHDESKVAAAQLLLEKIGYVLIDWEYARGFVQYMYAPPKNTATPEEGLPTIWLRNIKSPAVGTKFALTYLHEGTWHRAGNENDFVVDPDGTEGEQFAEKVSIAIGTGALERWYPMMDNYCPFPAGIVLT